MEQERFARVGELMANMAEPGGGAAAFTLQSEFAGPLRAAVRRALDGRGVSLPVSEVDDLVADVVMMLCDVAGAWRPDGGALPWGWAAARVNNLVDRHIGVFADELDEQRCAVAEQQASRTATQGGGAEELPADEVLERLSAYDPQAELLLHLLTDVASSRDGRLWLEVKLQRSLGDRSPAVSVSRLVGLSPAAVRQQYRRVEQRLRHAIIHDERFEALASLACVNDAVAA